MSAGLAQYGPSSWSDKQICTQFQFPEWKNTASLSCIVVASDLQAAACLSFSRELLLSCAAAYLMLFRPDGVIAPTTRGTVPSREHSASRDHFCLSTHLVCPPDEARCLSLCSQHCVALLCVCQAFSPARRAAQVTVFTCLGWL